MQSDNTSADYELVAYVKKQPVWAFCLLCFFTFGLYTLYWSYKNWRLIKERDELDIYPFWRAVFIIFFAHALLDRINDYAVEKGHPGMNSNVYATGFVVLLFVQRILGRVLPDQIALLSLLSVPFVFLIPGVNQLNFIADTTSPNTYRPALSATEVIVLLLGGLLTGLALIGSFLD